MKKSRHSSSLSKKCTESESGAMSSPEGGTMKEELKKLIEEMTKEELRLLYIVALELKRK